MFSPFGTVQSSFFSDLILVGTGLNCTHAYFSGLIICGYCLMPRENCLYGVGGTIPACVACLVGVNTVHTELRCVLLRIWSVWVLLIPAYAWRRISASFFGVDVVDTGLRCVFSTSDTALSIFALHWVYTGEVLALAKYWQKCSVRREAVVKLYWQ